MDGVLDRIWDRIINFLKDQDENGMRIIQERVRLSARERFLHQCANLADPRYGNNHIRLHINSLYQAFQNIRMEPMPTIDELRRLCKGLYAYHNYDSQIVDMYSLLWAITSREHRNYKGIFPRANLGKTSMNDQYLTNEKEREEQKAQQQEQDEIKRDIERIAREIQQRIAQDRAQAKSQARAPQPTVGDGSQQQQLSREQRQAQQRRHQAAEANRKREEEAAQKEEDKRVKLEVTAFKKLLTKIKGQFTKNRTYEQLEQYFRLYDSDGTSRLTMQEFTRTRLQLGIHFSELDFVRIHEVLAQGEPTVDYKELCQIMFDRKQVDLNKLIAERRQRQREKDGPTFDYQDDENMRMISMQINQDYDRAGSERPLESVNLSSVMGQSTGRSQPQVNTMKENPQAVANNFQQMQQAIIDKYGEQHQMFNQLRRSSEGKGDKVTLDDFTKLINDACGTSKFSAIQIKQVFLDKCPRYRRGDNESQVFFTANEFKDYFMPARRYTADFTKGDPNAQIRTRAANLSEVGEDSEEEQSIHLDDMMQGKAVKDIREQREKDKGSDLKEANIMMAFGDIHDTLNRDFEQHSEFSERLDNIINVKAGDPRKLKEEEEAKAAALAKATPSRKQKGSNARGGAAQKEQTKVPAFGNVDFYRQNDARQPYEIGKTYKVSLLENLKGMDQSVDKMMIKFANALIDDFRAAGPAGGTGKNDDLDYGRYVDRYGKTIPNHIVFKELKEMYLAHVHFADTGSKEPVNQRFGEDLDNCLRAVFNTIDPDQSGSISREQFVNWVNTKEPATLERRLEMRLKRGGKRLLNAIKEEMRVADQRFGANGLIPLPAFQKILQDFEIQVVNKDQKDLREETKYHGFIKTDAKMNDFIEWKQFIDYIAPQSKQPSTEQKEEAAIKIQAWFKMWSQLRKFKYIQKVNRTSGVQQLRQQKNALEGRGELAAKDEEKKKPAKKKKPTPEEQKREQDRKKRGEQINRKNANNINETMKQNVKLKAKADQERLNKMRQENEEYIKNVIIEGLIEKAYCYGESLQVCRDIQKKYENRPVTKYVYPLIKDFNYPAQGVSAKSLQPYNALGQVLSLNAQNQLSQFDIATRKNLAPISLGTRPPLKHYDIIDMVVDQRSGRIYTINANWILEIWNIEQKETFPQKRIAVCSNEGGRDFVKQAYKETFNDAKPRFLCLQESNQQVLVVNTTCVDSSIVFIDPISFSILKKIHLTYTDYELPIQVRKAVKDLRKVFEEIRLNKGKDLKDIFMDVVDKKTEEIPIRRLINKLGEYDKSLTKEELTKTVQILDVDGSGSISLDEFVQYFSRELEDDDDYHKAQEERIMQQENYPEWVIQENLLPEVQTTLQTMFNQLSNMSMTADKAFSLYDRNESGFSTSDEFDRILNAFFKDVLTETQMMIAKRLANPKANIKVAYRNFCKMLSKSFVKTFKLVKQSTNENAEEGSKQKTALEAEMERPIIKTATLNYILRKAAELKIDLRQELKSHDPLDLSVISRVNFQLVILNLPLGMNEDDMIDVFDHDLNYDNNGNVDYMSILNSDLFVALENKRLTELAQESSAKRVRIQQQQEDQDQNTAENEKKKDVAASDNRKVIVEDLIFIDDLEIIIYTTVRPQTSTIFITSMCKTKKTEKLEDDEDAKEKHKYINLEELKMGQMEQCIEDKKEQQKIDAKKEKEQQSVSYPLIAKLRGHGNDCAPSVCYIPQSCCLVSAEKNQKTSPSPKDNNSKNDDPNEPPNHKMSQGNRGGYHQSMKRHNSRSGPFSILIWNLQKDMIANLTVNFPWNVPYHYKFDAHDSNIIDICYLTKSQLLVTAAEDQTIKFWDPVQSSYELTDPSNNPHAQMKPGYYEPLKSERTQTNKTFQLVKCIYCGNETNCYALRTLNISNVILNKAQPDVKSQLEQLICFTCPEQTNINKEMSQKTRAGTIVGYGIERIKIEIPAKHLDDIVPPYVMKECEDLVKQRRTKITAFFQQQLPSNIEKVFSQTQLQSSYMEKIRGLFMQAILNRKDDQFVNPVPLREVYKVILKLPARTKFESFLASSGCSDKLSVSETFFYLQKFMQIHPLRTTQIEFEKSIEDFYNRHQRKFLKGIKRWPKEAIQKFSDYIRHNGFDTEWILAQNKDQTKVKIQSFTTRENFDLYFNHIETPDLMFEKEVRDIIMNEMDPYMTGTIQLDLVKSYFKEEIDYHKATSSKRPEEIIAKIRNIAFPNKKIALQQSLASADEIGDGQITQQQFIDALYRVGIEVDRDQLELLFQVYGTRFDTPMNMQTSKVADEKFLNLNFFLSKLFRKNEYQQVAEVDMTMQNIKAAMIYKGIDFGNIFAEKQIDESKKQTRKPRDAAIKEEKPKDDGKIDLNCTYSRFAQQIVKEEFIERVNQLKANKVTIEAIKRLANYLSLNQKNQSVVYLNTWLHHLRRVGTEFHAANEDMMPIICSKLLTNKSVFISFVESTAQVKQKPDDQKLVDLASLRQVLRKFGISYINQGMFLNKICEGSPKILSDIICKMEHYQRLKQSISDSNIENPKLLTIADIKKTDYFHEVQRRIQEYQAMDGTHQINIGELKTKMRKFDECETGLISVYKLINILKYNMDFIFNDSRGDGDRILMGLQFELESLNYEHLVDYEEFIKIFLQPSVSKKHAGMAEIAFNIQKNARTMSDYEELLAKIKSHVEKKGIKEIMPIFEIFCKKSGFISYDDLRKIIDLLTYPITEEEFMLLTEYADESGQENVHAYDLAQQIENAESVAPQYNPQRWDTASQELQGNYNLLEQVYEYYDQIKDEIYRQDSMYDTRFQANTSDNQQMTIAQQMKLQKQDRQNRQEFNQFVNDNRGDQFKSVPKSQGQPQKPGQASNQIQVVNGYTLRRVLETVLSKMSQPDIHLLLQYAIKGSKRDTEPSERINRPIDVNEDLIQISHFERSLPQVIGFMRKGENDRKQKESSKGAEYDIPKELQKKLEFERREKLVYDNERVKREAQVINKITQIFREREVSFFDAFQSVYDPLSTNNTIQITKFKEFVAQLNLPLTVQDQRVLRRIADPNSTGKVQLNDFCARFETPDLRMIRLKQTYEKISTAFYLQNFNLKKAFQLFDVNGDGFLTKSEIRQGFETLEIGIKYDEINDLVQMMAQRAKGMPRADDKINYEVFSQMLSENIRSQKIAMRDNIEDEVFTKVWEALRHIGDENPDKVLEQTMMIYNMYDEDEPTIQARDLLRVFKRLGLSSIEEHMGLIFQAGGLKPEDQKVKIRVFMTKFLAELGKRFASKSTELKRTINKLRALLETQKLSLFDFFTILDTNHSGTVNKTELKTGIARMNLQLSSKEMQQLWKELYKNKKDVKTQSWQNRGKKDNKRKVEEISYFDLLKGFSRFGFGKLDHASDKAETLIAKFRAQLKKLNISVEKLYKQYYDPKDIRFVMKNDFIEVSCLIGFEFSDQDYVKIFDAFCAQGKDPNDKEKHDRFTQKQLQDAILVQRDQDWIYKAYIKIHSLVLQKGYTYKRLFSQWRGNKNTGGKLSEKEIIAGLRKFKAGLTQDEIDKLAAQLRYEGKEHVISEKAFEDTIINGAKKLEQEQDYERMQLQEWNNDFQEQLNRNFAPLDNLFQVYDSRQDGNMEFADFAKMNEAIGVSMNRKDLNKIFKMLDRKNNNKLRLEEIRNITQLKLKDEEEEGKDMTPDYMMKEVGLSVKDTYVRQKTNELYDEIKTKLEAKNTTLEQIFFNDLKFDPIQKISHEILEKALDKLQIIMTKNAKEKILNDAHQHYFGDKEIQKVLSDVQKHYHGMFEISLRRFIDFMTKIKVNIAFQEKGFIDPLLANTVQAINKVKDQYDLGYNQLFNMLDAKLDGKVTKDQFVTCLNGMALGCSQEDISELFNNLDEKQDNKIDKKQFINKMTYISQKMGGPSPLEQMMNKGIIQIKKKENQPKYNSNQAQGPNSQFVYKVIKEICEAVEKRQLTITQISNAYDLNKTGYINRQEFTSLTQSLAPELQKPDVTAVADFLDGDSSGKISINTFSRIILEILNQKIGGGVYANMQVKPLIKKIINELSVECDKFFDEIADENQKYLDKSAKENQKEFSAIDLKFRQVGLKKSIFVNALNKYGVSLSEREFALISSVFGLSREDRDKLDYFKIDAAFEAEQQTLINEKKQYTNEWERRVFKRMGDYLMRHNKSINETFDLINTNSNMTISVEEFRQAILRMDIDLGNKQLETFLERIIPRQGSGYITKGEFIQRFWAAYTYDDVIEDGENDEDYEDEQKRKLKEQRARELRRAKEQKVILPDVAEEMQSSNIRAANLKMQNILDMKVHSFRMFKSVQKRFRESMPVQQAFVKLDQNDCGQLSIRDFQMNLQSFNLSLKAKEVRELFQEIDRDQNGIIKFQELEEFYERDYSLEIERVQNDRKDARLHNEIFDHLIKVLKQRGISLYQVFEEIDDDGNGYIDVEEFHDMLQSMGFTISGEQVFNLVRLIDENFDGKISYQEMRDHLQNTLNYDVEELEYGKTNQVTGKRAGLQGSQITKHQWRDKALELVIKASKNWFNKNGQLRKHAITADSQTKVPKDLTEYFTQYDQDHDGFLAPGEFRKALQDFKEPMLKQTQIERILHIVLEDRKLKPVAKISRVVSLLEGYKYLNLQDGAVLIDEDLFVYIVEKYDGISRMMEFVSNLTDKATYLQRHTYELSMRGLCMMSNQKQVQKLTSKSDTLNELFQSTLILLAGEVTRLMKEEAVLTTLDPGKNNDNIVTDQNFGVLNAVSLPTIENSQFDVDYQSVQTLPCGAQQYSGTLMSTKEPIEILLYPSDNLQYVSLDGKPYKKHLELEMKIHRYMMGAKFEEDDELLNPDAFKDEDLDIFANIGKFEKKIGLSANDKEVYVVNKQINEDQWINLDDFVTRNGGILNIPLFYHTEAPLYIIRHWAKLILQIISKVHDVSVVLRCLNTKQLWISRDGQRIRLGHVRGAGRVNNLGNIKSSPDIYLNLENNERNATRDDNKSTGFSPSKTGGAGGFQSSRRTNNDQPRMFSNKALDDPFVAPEVLFSKFSDHTAQMDVWGFGMIMFCLIFGRKPVSYYSTYRQWLLKAHQTDAEMGNLPFTKPSSRNFIYDPFSIDFENPFEKVNMEDLAATHFKQKMSLEEVENQFRQKDGMINFSNFMKCISDLSYSGMFTSENSKKFDFKRIIEPEHKNDQDREDQELDKVMQDDIHNPDRREERRRKIEDRELAKQKINKDGSKVKLTAKEQEKVEKKNKVIEEMLKTIPYRFPGQKDPQRSTRNAFLLCLAKAEVLERKNELGLILDLIASCLDVDPKKRPQIQGLLTSPIFFLDKQERTNAVRFSQTVILYRSPISSVCQAITHPLRQICAETMKGPMNVYDHTENILKLFLRVEDAIAYNTALPIDELNEVMTESEKRKGVTAHMAKRGIDSSKFRVSPNSPLAAQVVEDKVLDMLLFITFRYMKNFKTWKKKELENLEMRIQMLQKEDQQNQRDVGAQSVTNTQGGHSSKTGKSKASSSMANQAAEVKKNMKQLENQVLQKMTHLLKVIVYQMHSYNTPMAPHVNEVIQYIVKFFIGEEHVFGSDVVLNRTAINNKEQLKIFLRERSFFRRDCELDSKFKSDQADKLWHLEQKNKSFLDKSNYWCPELYTESLKIYRDAISESGRGQSCYPVICDYITSISNSFEPTKIFSKQMSHLSMSFLIPMHRTSAYYNELIPIAESLSRLYNPSIDKSGKGCSLAMVRSVFQTGNSDKIKACLDMRVPKHLVHFIQDSDPTVRKESLYTYLEISKGLQDDDFEVISKNAANIKREFSRHGYTKTSFDLHKAISMASQSEVLDAQAKIDKANATQRRGTQARQKHQEPSISQTEAQCNYIKRTIALIEKNENEKYINFALDLPNLNFLASKRFLKEMAVCFESPVFIAPLIRLLKTPTENFQNKQIILDIFKNLVCGNERVLIALNSPASDTYMTLLKILMMNTKMKHARENPNSQGVSTEMRNTLALQDKTKDLFVYMFDQSRPTILRDIKCIGASHTLLREQDLSIPVEISLPELVNFFDQISDCLEVYPHRIASQKEPILAQYREIRRDEKDRQVTVMEYVTISKFIKKITTLRCWVKHFFTVCPIPELTKIKAMQRCMNLIIRVIKEVWREYFRYDSPKSDDEKPRTLTEQDLIDCQELMRLCLKLFDWLCVNNKFLFLFNEESGRANMAFIINTCNMILSQFRKPLYNTNTDNNLDTALPQTEDQLQIDFGFKPQQPTLGRQQPIPTMEDLAWNTKPNKAVQDKRKYDMFPFTDIGSILQNIQYQLVRKDDPFINQLLSEANFGFVFGEQMLLDYDFIRHCIDNCVESLVLMDSYVKKNEIRLNTFEYIMRSSETTIKDQLIKSNFCERVFLDFVRDFREFNIQFSKIDLEFLAFRRSYPLRLEAISLINTTLMLRNHAPQIYNEFLMYARRHFLVKKELDMLRGSNAVTSKEATCLLLFAIFLESNESDLIYVMVQENAARTIQTLMQEQPSLNKRFPILREFINRF